jgi:hypothetical protein
MFGRKYQENAADSMRRMQILPNVKNICLATKYRMSYTVLHVYLITFSVFKKH